jgi:hypothetical protein
MDEALLTENDDRSGNESNMKEGEEDMGKPMEVNVMGNDACERVEEIISPASYVSLFWRGQGLTKLI